MVKKQPRAVKTAPVDISLRQANAKARANNQRVFVWDGIEWLVGDNREDFIRRNKAV